MCWWSFIILNFLKFLCTLYFFCLWAAYCHASTTPSRFCFVTWSHVWPALPERLISLILVIAIYLLFHVIEIVYNKMTSRLIKWSSPCNKHVVHSQATDITTWTYQYTRGVQIFAISNMNLLTLAIQFKKSLFEVLKYLRQLKYKDKRCRCWQFSMILLWLRWKGASCQANAWSSSLMLNTF